MKTLWSYLSVQNYRHFAVQFDWLPVYLSQTQYPITCPSQ